MQYQPIICGKHMWMEPFIFTEFQAEHCVPNVISFLFSSIIASMSPCTFSLIALLLITKRKKEEKKTHIKFSTLLAMNVIVPFNGMKYRKVLFYQSPRTIMWFQRTIKSTKTLQLSPFAKSSPLFSIRFLWASEWVCVNGIYPSVYDIHVETK